MPKLFEVGVKAVVCHPEEPLRLVMTRDIQAKKGHTWCIYDLPGGRMEQDEQTPLQTLQRELQEELGLTETGYEIENTILAGGPVRALPHIFLVCYSVQAKTERIICSTEHNGFAWMSEQEITALRPDNADRIIDPVLQTALLRSF